MISSFQGGGWCWLIWWESAEGMLPQICKLFLAAPRIGVQEYRYALSTAPATSYLLLPSSKRRQRVVNISDIESTFIKAHYPLSHILGSAGRPLGSTLLRTHGIHTNSSPLSLCFALSTFCPWNAISLYSLSRANWVACAPWRRNNQLVSCAFTLQMLFYVETNCVQPRWDNQG